jgi:4-nitrophenyl phosphatase
MSITDRYAGFIIDLDGVVFQGDTVVRDAVQFIKRARRGGLPLVFVSNNSARTPDEWAAACERHKLKLDPEDILTSAAATAAMLVADPPPRCLVVGEYGLVSALRQAGIELVEDHREADTVVVGWDTRLTYDKLRAATAAIARGARFVGTNPDRIYPTDAAPWPGNGATLAYLQAATGVAPEVAGKPQTPLFELAGQRLAADGPVLVVGDQVETDVVAARRMGWDAALVLTGVSSWASLIGATAAPTWVVPHLGDLDGPEPPIVRHAREADVSAIRGLLEACGFDVAGAARRLRDSLVAENPDGTVVGTASWELLDSAAHLRGITVDERERGHGTASHLVARALDELTQANVDWVYLLTPGADELFEKLGFWRVHRDRVPDEILRTAQFGPAASGGRALVRRLRN